MRGDPVELRALPRRYRKKVRSHILVQRTSILRIGLDRNEKVSHQQQQNFPHSRFYQEPVSFDAILNTTVVE